MACLKHKTEREHPKRQPLLSKWSNPAPALGRGSIHPPVDSRALVSEKRARGQQEGSAKKKFPHFLSGGAKKKVCTSCLPLKWSNPKSFKSRNSKTAKQPFDAPHKLRLTSAKDGGLQASSGHGRRTPVRWCAEAINRSPEKKKRIEYVGSRRKPDNKTNKKNQGILKELGPPPLIQQS